MEEQLMEVGMCRKMVVLLIFLFSMTLFGENHWIKVGDSLSTNRIYDVAIVFSNSGTMFISFEEQDYMEYTDGPYRASVKQYNRESKTWEYVGIPKFSPELLGGCMGSNPLSLVISNDTPFIAYMTGNAERNRKIMTYLKSTEQWGYPDDNIPAGDGLTILKVDKNGKLYIAFASIPGTNKGITVMSSDNGTDWEYCGKHPLDMPSNGFFDFVFSPQGVPVLSSVSPLLLPDDVAASVAYSYDAESKEWHQLGKRGFSGPIDEHGISVPHLVANTEGELFCYFSTDDHKGVRLMKYDATADSWTFLPNVDIPAETTSWKVSIGHNSDFFFSFRSGEEYITKIMKYNFTLSKWEIIGDEIVGLICSAPVFNKEDIPFISCLNKNGQGVVMSLGSSEEEENNDEDTSSSLPEEESNDEDISSSSPEDGSACAALMI